MKKLLVVALVVFAMAFGLALFSADQPQAGTRCWYDCDCNGVTLYCCRTNGKVLCKIVLNSPVECTQQAGC